MELVKHNNSNISFDGYSVAYLPFYRCFFGDDASTNKWSEPTPKRTLSRWNGLNKYIATSLRRNWYGSCDYDYVCFSNDIFKRGNRSLSARSEERRVGQRCRSPVVWGLQNEQEIE